MGNSKNILNIENLEIGYPLKKDINNILFKDINLSGNSGELIALIGKNGIGKSTLLRNIAGLQEPIGGNIFFYNKLIKKYKRSAFARMVSFVSTEILHVSNLKVFDLVALGRFPHTNWMGKLQTEDIVRSNSAIEMVGMDSYLNKNIDEISDGERQRVMIARTLAQDTKIIVLDEPTAFLDLPNKYEIVHLLNNLSKNENKTIIFSTHDLNIAIHEADKIWLMLDDSIIEGAPEDLILNDTFNKLFENSNLNFDKIKGDFSMKRKHAEKIGLIGDGIYYNWTKKALERLGFSIQKGKNDLQNIRIEFRNEICVWILSIEKNEYIFNSIYDLSLYLKSQTKK
jgi:iron complex transport system ATP-binding protein